MLSTVQSHRDDCGGDDGRQTVEGAVVSALSPVTHSLVRPLAHSLTPTDSRLIFAEKDDGGRPANTYERDSEYCTYVGGSVELSR